MEPTSLIIGGVIGAGAVKLLSTKKTARKPRATTAKKRVAKKAVSKKPVAKKTVARKPAAKKPAAKKKVVTKSRKQTGSSNRTADKRQQAMKPGKRISANGNVYYEKRANRSDVGKLLGSQKKK